MDTMTRDEWEAVKDLEAYQGHSLEFVPLGYCRKCREWHFLWPEDGDDGRPTGALLCEGCWDVYRGRIYDHYTDDTTSVAVDTGRVAK